MTTLPENFSYYEEHEWINAAADEAVGQEVTVGITHVATEALGEIVFVDLPAVGSTVEAGESCGEVESTKSVSDIFSPVSGEVTAINEDVDADPSLINSDPYGAAWLFKVTVTETATLMTAAEYSEANEL